MKVDRFTKSVFLANCVVPVAILGWDALGGRLGANPVNFAIRTTGLLALLFLVLSLAVTPLSRITGRGWLGQFRRILGLNAFFHTALHFLLFAIFDRGGDVLDTLSEIVQRPYLTVGAFALLLMVPLAATSTNGMIKRIGPARWKLLHRLAYIASGAGALHYYMLVKADVSQPLAFAAVLGVLLVYRGGDHYWQLRRDALRFRFAPPVPFPPTVSSTATAPPAKKPKSWSGELKVTHVFDETPEVRTFRLTSPSGARLPFVFLPGQFLSIALVIDGKKVRRSYTLASAPTRTGGCELTIKRESRGLVSRHLHEQIRVGDLVSVVAPAGRFTFTEKDSDSIVIIAGGVGITPLMSMIRYLTDVGWTGDIHLVFSVKTRQDIIFRDELEALARRHPNLHITITLTREEGTAWNGERGRISPELLTRVVPNLAARRVHICGPTEMIEPTRRMLAALGVPDKAIHVESFTSPSRAPSLSAEENGEALRVPSTPLAVNTEIETDGEAAVTFARSVKSSRVPPGQTVLEAAESLGVPINHDCRAGICGQCKVKVLSGRVVMEAEDALNAGDRANNVILSCQARCIDQVVIDA
jgi:ferredoxin-NADP reductase/DMSO/TMAO reductase YedYZ heme-binding membrane subunit